MNLEYAKNENDNVPSTISQKKNKNVNLGKYARMREHYLQENHKALYEQLIMKGEIVNHLLMIDKEARKMVNLLINALAKKENVDEHLKKTNQILWMQQMNNIKNRAEEIVINELIYH